MGIWGWDGEECRKVGGVVGVDLEVGGSGRGFDLGVGGGEVWDEGGEGGGDVGMEGGRGGCEDLGREVWEGRGVVGRMVGWRK